eukprot:5810162-Amphidinium_carterae.1
MKGSAEYNSIGQGIPNQGLDERATLHKQVPNQRVCHRNGAIHTPISLCDMLHAPGSDPHRVERIVLESSGNNEIVIGQHRPIVQDAASLLPIYLHHTAIKHADAQLKHDPS